MGVSYAVWILLQIWLATADDSVSVGKVFFLSAVRREIGWLSVLERTSELYADVIKIGV